MITKITSSTLQAQSPTFIPRVVAVYGITTLIFFLTLICLFTPSELLFKQIAAYTLYIMLGLLLAGFVFFLMKQERLMMVSFLCCSILCLHLKSSANKQMRLAQETKDPSLNVSFINLANAESDYGAVIAYLLELNTDFISVQELTPDWNAELTRGLSSRYQYIHTMTRLDQYGMGFFSKKPLLSIDTIYHGQVPSLTSAIQLDPLHRCQVVSCQTVPPVSQAAFFTIDQHFNYLSSYLNEIKGSFLVMGDLHLPPWSAELQRFKASSKLEDSRRDINPRYIDGSVSLPRIPVEHILFCERFECTSFSELGNDTVGRLGITGTYQLHNGFADMAD